MQSTNFLIVLNFLITAIIVIAFFSMLGFLLFRAYREFKEGRKTTGLLYSAPVAFSLIVFIVGACTIYFLFLPGGDKIIARVTSENGVEMCITQKYGDFYEIRFFRKRPGEEWGAFYYDHQDLRWLRGRIEINEKSSEALIYKGGTVVAKYDIRNDSFERMQNGSYAVKKIYEMPKGWTPEEYIENNPRRLFHLLFCS
jgi:hypothetical protein